MDQIKRGSRDDIEATAPAMQSYQNKDSIPAVD